MFAVRIIKLVYKLPNTSAGRAIGNQIVRSGTSPGANYRAACVGKSDKDFLNKLKMVEEELDETAYWLELIIELELVKPDLLQDLYLENKELLKIQILQQIRFNKFQFYYKLQPIGRFIKFFLYHF